MDVRRLRADEWERWREFRLAMLAEAPYAFGTTLAEMRDKDDAFWRDRAATMATSEHTALYVAEDGGTWLASAGCYVEDGVPNVFSVWTRPEARGRGAAHAAIEAAIGWARETTDATEVRLWATDTNVTARRLYERLGFSPNGNVQPLPSDPSLSESEWSRPL